MRLNGKRVLITGAAAGIGRAGALLFSREGARVALVDVDEERLLEVSASLQAEGHSPVVIRADLADREASARIVEEAADGLGGLDTLWCNAGIMGPTEIEHLDASRYDETVAINMSSPITSCGAALPHLRREGGGNIVITASTSGLVGAMSGAVYTATKFAVVGYVKALAQRVAEVGVRVNAVCPGPVLTPLMQSMIDQGTKSMSGNEYAERLLAGVPLKRFALPEEIAEAALWLASPDSSYVTGVALPVDGGYTCR